MEKHITFEELMKLWETNPNIARTYNNKIRLKETFRKIKEFAEQMEHYSDCIPLEDDDFHSAVVDDLTHQVENLWKRMDKTIYDAIYNPNVSL